VQQLGGDEFVLEGDDIALAGETIESDGIIPSPDDLMAGVAPGRRIVARIEDHSLDAKGDGSLREHLGELAAPKYT